MQHSCIGKREGNAPLHFDNTMRLDMPWQGGSHASCYQGNNYPALQQWSSRLHAVSSKGNLQSQGQIMDTIYMALAGRASEEVFFGSVMTGASDDLRRVLTGLA
jgi:Peptidase family M41